VEYKSYGGEGDGSEKMLLFACDRLFFPRDEISPESWHGVEPANGTIGRIWKMRFWRFKSDSWAQLNIVKESQHLCPFPSKFFNLFLFVLD